MLKRTGEVEHPSLRPLSGSHSPLTPSFPLTLYLVVSWRPLTTLIIFYPNPYLSNNIQRAGLLTLGYAFLRSRSRASGHSPWSRSLLPPSTLLLKSSTSSSSLTITWTTSAVDLPLLKPAWLSSKIPILSAQTPNLLAATLAKILLPMAKRHTPLKLFTSPLSPFLCRGTIIPTFIPTSHCSAGVLHISWTILTTLSTISAPPFLI